MTALPRFVRRSALSFVAPTDHPEVAAMFAEPGGLGTDLDARIIAKDPTAGPACVRALDGGREAVSALRSAIAYADVEPNVAEAVRRWGDRVLRLFDGEPADWVMRGLADDLRQLAGAPPAHRYGGLPNPYWRPRRRQVGGLSRAEARRANA